jgi:hypothetical protein
MPAPEDMHALAETEKGRVLDQYTFGDIETTFKTLILNGGNIPRTKQILADEGLTLGYDTIRQWRDRWFPQRYREIRSELAPELSEEVAAKAMERAIQADDAEELYLRHAVQRVEEVSPDKLAPGVLALAKAKAENIDKAQLLRDRPTEIKEVRDTAALLDVLRRAGVINRDPEFLDAEVIEDSAGGGDPGPQP